MLALTVCTTGNFRMSAMHQLPVALSCRRRAALPDTPNQRHHARIPPRQEGRIAIVTNVRWGAVAATERETSARGCGR